ncbi:hypothetical protein [Glycomyces tritici]|uniref:Nudix hydrolase domain-containing protein n=1 Tax=Glycomyces tritici TaxID=2665176 RepID=A0ABT7YM14_9ACTN|nr:hypothetical protein [Glycomyces tritici]MDN3239681.1 hypothetical protein [Glycomyces tritici]
MMRSNLHCTSMRPHVTCFSKFGWHLIHATPESVAWFSEEEVSGIKWLSLPQLLDEPIETLDPHLHRFANKLWDALTRQSTI